MRRSSYVRPKVGATVFRIKWDAVGNLAAAILLAVTLLTWAGLTLASNVAPDTERPNVGAMVTFHVPTGVDRGDSFTLPPCPTEDSPGCYWDGSTRGEPGGLTFFTTPDDVVHYIDSIPGK